MLDIAFVLIVITGLLVVVGLCQPLAAYLKLPPPVLLGVVGLVVLFRLIAAPYWVYRTVMQQRDLYRDELIKLKQYKAIERVEGINDSE